MGITLDLSSKLGHNNAQETFAFRAAMQRQKRELNRTYTIFGSGAWGGCSAIQAKLMEHGVCSYTGWAPGPPRWRFLFDTYLTAAEIQVMLGDLWKRYEVQLKE